MHWHPYTASKWPNNYKRSRYLKQIPLTTNSALCLLKKSTPSPIYPSISFLEIWIDGVVKQLKNLTKNKATGPDELSARVLKETVHSGNSPNYHAHFSAIIQHFRTSRSLAPCNNNTDKPKNLRLDPADYRPISLPCILCKIKSAIYGNTYTNTTSSSTSNKVSSQGCLVSPNSSRQSMIG